jgi:hypothetical protein
MTNGSSSAVIRLSIAMAALLLAHASSASTFSAGVAQGPAINTTVIPEASGLVASPDNPGVFWTENDSGNPNSIFAIDSTGALLGTYYLDGATNTDWEEISVGPGPEAGVNYLYLYEVDHTTNNRATVWRVPEPTVYASQQVASPITAHPSGTLGQTFSLQIPPGQANVNDGEAMFIDRQNGDIYMGSKENNVTKFFRATQAQFGAAGTQTASYVTTISAIEKANGAAISPSGNEIFVRNNHSPALLYHRTGNQTIAQALSSPTHDSIAINDTNIEPQAEAIAFDADGINFYTISEYVSGQPLPKLYKYTRTSNDGPTAHVSLLSPAASWKYLDAGAAPGANWNQPGFNDSTWSSGSGPFGYGQGNEHTVLSYGGNPNSKPASDIFRTTFNVTNPHLLTDLTLKLLVDDGAAVYLNGTEIDRFNLAAAATLADFAQSSVSNAFQNSWRSLTFDRSLLVAGANTLAIEVHGSSALDNDLRFDAQISALPVAPTAGDFNLDGHVDSADIAAMLSAMADLNQYQADNGLSAAQVATIADLNHNGFIDNADIQSLISKLLAGNGSQSSVPEPSCFLLAFSALLALPLSQTRRPRQAS